MYWGRSRSFRSSFRFPSDRADSWMIANEHSHVRGSLNDSRLESLLPVYEEAINRRPLNVGFDVWISGLHMCGELLQSDSCKLRRICFVFAISGTIWLLRISAVLRDTHRLHQINRFNSHLDQAITWISNKFISIIFWIRRIKLSGYAA